MKKKKWIIPVVVIGVICVLLIGVVGILASGSFDMSQGRYLEAKNGQSMFVLDNSPIQMSNRTRKDIFDDLEVGDKILVIHDGIAETYPGKTGAYAIFKLSDGTADDISQTVVNGLTELGWLESKLPEAPIEITKDVETAVSYANWTDDPAISTDALNADKMNISGEKHLPVFKMETKQELEQFKTNYGKILSMNQSYGDIPSFEEVTSKYDEAFFEENVLLIVYVDANSGSLRFDVSSVYSDNESVCVHVKQTNNPEVVTDDMAGWFITVAIQKSTIRDCKSFDADFNNIE